MPLAIFSCGEFGIAQEREENLAWINKYFRALTNDSVNVVLFHPSETKLKRDCLVHVFGFENFENWHWIKKLSAGLLLSPYPLAMENSVFPDALPKKKRTALKSCLEAVDVFVGFESESISFGGIEIALEKHIAVAKDPMMFAKRVREIHDRFSN